MTNPQPAAEKIPWRRRVLRRVERWLAVAGCFFILYHVGFGLSRMTSGSMSPTLQGTGYRNGDWVLTEKMSYRLRGPRRWEVVTFHNEDGVQIMKRVAGLPGESVSLRDGRVQINGEPEAVPPGLDFLYYYDFAKLRRGNSVSCGEGYFVLGDYSRDSQDSRFEGPIQQDQILGRAWLVVWPPSRIGWVNP